MFVISVTLISTANISPDSFRLDNAELFRKVGKNQTTAVRILLTGSHEKLMKIEWRVDDASLVGSWTPFGTDKEVSYIPQMDKKRGAALSSMPSSDTTVRYSWRLISRRSAPPPHGTRGLLILWNDTDMTRTMNRNQFRCYTSSGGWLIFGGEYTVIEYMNTPTFCLCYFFKKVAKISEINI